jgi:hypothetical protein
MSDNRITTVNITILSSLAREVFPDGDPIIPVRKLIVKVAETPNQVGLGGVSDVGTCAF